MQGNFGTFVFIFCKDTELRIGRGSLDDDGAAIPHLLGAAERLGVRRHEVEDAVEHFANAHAARAPHECTLYPVALSAPLVLDRNGAVDDVEPGIMLGMAIKEAG